MISPEQAALAHAICDESEATFEEAVQIAGNMIRFLEREGYEIRKRNP